MHDPIAHKLGIVQRGYHRKNALLLREPEVRLEADEVIDAALAVVAPQLHHGKGLVPRPRVLEPARLERPVAQSVASAARHDLNRHAALKNVLVLKAVHRSFLRGRQCLPEGKVLLLGHWAVYIICRTPVVARGKPRA